MPSTQEWLGGTIGGLGGLGLALHQLLRERRADELENMRLLRDQGTFVPVPESRQPPRTFFEKLFGTGMLENTFDLGGGRMMRFQPYEPLGPEGARALDLTYPETRTVAPMQDLTALDGTPAGYAIGRLPTPAAISEEVPIPGAAELRLGPKESLEVLKERARQRRDQAVAANRLERTRLWLTRTPASVAKYQWLIDSLDSDDPTTRELAEAELSRLQAPGRRADTAEDRLDQTYTMHRERLQAAMDLLEKRLAAAKDRGDARAQAALERQRERFLERLDEIQILEGGRDFRATLGSDTKLEIAGAPGTRADAVTDMKTDEAVAKLKEFRAKMYFPGTSSQALDTLERIITTLQKQERSHIGPTLTRRLQRLGTQLDNAERKERVSRPQPQPPQSPPAGPSRQSSTGSGMAPAARSQSDQPTPQMLAAYQRYYEGMSPDEAEGDLKAEMAQDPSLTARGIPSPRTAAKQQAYSRVFNRPLTMRLPAPETPPPPAAATQPAAPAPQERPASPAPQTPQATPQSPQAHALVNRYVAYYDKLSDSDLAQEARRLERPAPGSMDTLRPYRQQAVQQVLEARQQAGAAASPDVPAPPDQATHRQVLEHYRRQYTHYSTPQLLEEMRRIQGSITGPLKALTQDVRTSLRLSAIQQLLAQRQAGTTPRTSVPGLEPEEP